MKLNINHESDPEKLMGIIFSPNKEFLSTIITIFLNSLIIYCWGISNDSGK